MGKVFVIALIVLGIWLAAQFAASTSPFSQGESGSERANIAARSGAKVQASLDQGNERREALLED